VMGADVTRKHNFHRNISLKIFDYGSSISKPNEKVNRKNRIVRMLCLYDFYR
jgi:hypothetical protein